MDEEMKRFLQEELKKEADQIMREVEADPEVADLTAPSEIDQKLYEQIKQYKEEHYAPEETLSGEQQELIRLGKIYKRKQKRRKYVVLAAAVVSAFAVGITSFGGPERILHKFNWNIGDREQTNFDSDDEDIVAAKASEEEEAYQKIKDEFGFEPVRMLYLPENMKFQEGTIFGEMQNAQIIYSDNKNKILRYQIVMDYKASSIGLDVEDQLIQKKELEIEKVPIEIRYYKIKSSGEIHINAMFKHKDIQYFLSGNNIKEEEFEKILRNLKIF
ncbi:MAG: DUF4367 domain-containing protein [Clostridiales bacterium]|nr:DUF4367 domain-containing protein [Clostridiales bacterium]